MKDNKYRKILLGNILVIAFYNMSPKSAKSKWPKYSISSMQTYKPKRVLEMAQKNNVP